MRVRNCAWLWLVLAAECFVTAPIALASHADGQNRSERIADLQSRAEKGYPDKQFELAQAYFLGDGVRQDLHKAAHWYERAAKAGLPEAENQLAYMYEKGIGVSRSPQLAVHWFQLAAASGLGWGKANLALCYLRGMGVPKNPSTARGLLLEALDKGEGVAAAFLGQIELFGLDGPEDMAAAEPWFRAGVRLHDPLSAFYLGYLYTNSDKHERDLEKGARLWRMSAEKGYVAAMHGLGLLLVNHPELRQEQGESVRLLQGASLAGNWKATAVLGVLARDGRGVTQDPAGAYFYFHLAELQGGTPAQTAVAVDVQKLAQELPGPVVLSSASRAETWFAQHGTPSVFVGPHAGTHLSSLGVVTAQGM